MIRCLCSYFNLTNNHLRKAHYITFRKHLQYPITTIEVALDKNQFFIEDSIKILANKENILWQKERMFNIALESLPSNINKIVWLDTDIIFLQNSWLKDLEKTLDDYTIVQPFDTVFEDKGANDCLNTNSYAKFLNNHLKYGTSIPRFAAIGLCWGLNRCVLNNGFYDKHILGSNDALQLLSVMGDFLNGQIMDNLSKPLIKDWLSYCESMTPLAQYNVGYCLGKIKHLYHGNEYKRGYHIREKLLNDYQYDPKKHLSIDTNGLYKIIDNQNLQNIIYSYFLDRHEHTNES